MYMHTQYIPNIFAAATKRRCVHIVTCVVMGIPDTLYLPVYFNLAEKGSAPWAPVTWGRQTPSSELTVTALLATSSPG